MANKSRTIRIPVHIVEREQKIARAERELMLRLERAPTDDEVARQAKLSPKHVAEVRSAARAVTSLDRPVGEEGDTRYGDLFAGKSPEPMEEVHVSFAESTVRRFPNFCRLDGFDLDKLGKPKGVVEVRL